jgi:hypothetical protein
VFAKPLGGGDATAGDGAGHDADDDAEELVRGRLFYHFAKLPAALRAEPELQRVAQLLFLRPTDHTRYEQYLWLSSVRQPAAWLSQPRATLQCEHRGSLLLNLPLAGCQLWRDVPLEII